MKVKSQSEVVQLYLTLSDPMSAPYQAPLTMGFSRQQYWSGIPLQSVNERKECLKTQNGTRPLIHKMHFGIILAPDDSSRAIK